jgi:NADPH:quinone reductase-like Zn-dependent oxidoreductase
LESLRQEEKILGRELSGVAELLGASGTKFKIGDKVFARNAFISVKWMRMVIFTSSIEGSYKIQGAQRLAEGARRDPVKAP